MKRAMTALVSTFVLGLPLAACSSPSDAGSADESAVTATTCGNGTRDTGEQCDDGNTRNLDGCDSTCSFEQENRIDSVALQFSTDSFCGANAIGKAIGSEAKSTISSALTSAIGDGSISILFKFMGLSDLSGQTDASFQVGGMVGAPVASSSYNGAKDLDDWYTPDETSLDSKLNPTALLAASFKAGALTAGPGDLDISLALGGSAIPVSLTGVKVDATATAASKPTESAGTTEPGHLASENLDPALTSFGGLSNGAICGNIVAASLAAAPVPPQLQSGATSCGEGYGANNSMLDVFVGGCSVFLFTIISKTQPDAVASTTAGGPFKLSASTSSKKVDTCTDASGKSVALSTCLADAAYSTYLTFTSDRVIVRAPAAVTTDAGSAASDAGKGADAAK